MQYVDSEVTLMKMSKIKPKKGQLNLAIPSVIALVAIAVVLGVGLTVLSEVQTTQTTNSAAFNATGEGIDGLATFSSFQTTIAVIVVAVIVIGLLLTGLAVQAQRRR